MPRSLHGTTYARWVVLAFLAAGGFACGTPRPSPEDALAPETGPVTPAESPATEPGTEAVPAPAVGPDTVPPGEGAAPPAPPRPPAPGIAAPGTTPPGPVPTFPFGSGVRRTGSGLPDELRGYQTWFRLPATEGSPDGEAPGERGHPLLSQAYIDSPPHRMAATGTELPPPLAAGTRIVLEAKSPPADFIEELSVMTRTDAGWEFSHFRRASREAAFEPADATACAGCHAKAAATDSVHARLILR